MAGGKVYIIGAGPGDWELVSLKGLKRLKESDVVLYDFLACEGLLGFAKDNAELICVGKADGLHILEQSQINALLYKKAREGKTVARLKGGDPFVFSRGIEEALYLKRKGIDFEIIPGITSAFAAPESFGIPLTRKGRYCSVAILTGRKSNGSKIDAPKADTLIYLMAVRNVSNVVKAVLGSGREKSTPCAFIEKGTTEKERIVTGNLGNIIGKVESYSVSSPAVFIIGKIINYGKSIRKDKFK